MKIQLVKTSELKPSEYNPRTWDDSQISGLKASISEYGLVDPIIVNCNGDRHNIVIGGHFRLHVAILLGIDKVPVNYVDLDHEKEKSLNIVLNNRHIQGNWKPEQALSQLSEIKDNEPELFEELNLAPLENDLKNLICDVEEQKEEKEDNNGGDWIHFCFGDIEGDIPIEIYEMFLSEKDRMGDVRETDKLPPIMEAILQNSITTPLESLK